MAKSERVRHLQHTQSEESQRTLWVPSHCLEQKVTSPSLHNSLTNTPPKCSVQCSCWDRAELRGRHLYFLFSDLQLWLWHLLLGDCRKLYRPELCIPTLLVITGHLSVQLLMFYSWGKGQMKCMVRVCIAVK